MPRRLLAAVLFTLPMLPAAAQTVTFGDLEGLAIEANWVERFKWRYVGEEKLTDTNSPRSLKMKIAPGGNIERRAEAVRRGQCHRLGERDTDR